MAYGKKGDLAQADLASAEAAFCRATSPTATHARHPRQDPVAGRLARLGARRRHRVGQGQDQDQLINPSHDKDTDQ